MNYISKVFKKIKFPFRIQKHKNNIDLLENNRSMERINYEVCNFSEFFEKIGPVTAKMIIRKRIDKYVYSIYGISEINHDNRFYIARITYKDLGTVKTVLIDRSKRSAKTLYCKSINLNYSEKI